MNKISILAVDRIFKMIEAEFSDFDSKEEIIDALEYFKNRSDMFIADEKKYLD